MLWRQPVVDRQDPAADGGGQVGEHRAVAVERADAVAAAVQVQDHRTVTPADPLPRDAARVHRLRRHAIGGAQHCAEAFVGVAPLLKGHLHLAAPGGLRAQHGDDVL